MPAATSLTLSVADAAELIGIDHTTAYRLIRAGDFPAPVVRIGGRQKVLRRPLERFLEEGTPTPAQSSTSLGSGKADDVGDRGAAGPTSAGVFRSDANPASGVTGPAAPSPTTNEARGARTPDPVRRRPRAKRGRESVDVSDTDVPELTILHNNWGTDDIGGSLMDEHGEGLWSHVSSSRGWLEQDLLHNFGREAELQQRYPDGFTVRWEPAS